MLRGILVWVAVVVFAPTPVSGQQPQRGCPKLFGSPKTRARNKAYRRRNLHWTLREPSGITVVHSNIGWEKVTPLSFEGITLEGRRGDGTVTVVLSKTLANKYGCAPGRHLIRRDDSLGRYTRALALLGDYVLVVHDGELGFLAPPEAHRPRWLLAWTLRGATIHPPRGGKVRRRPPAKTRRRRPKRKRPPGRPPKHEGRRVRKR